MGDLAFYPIFYPYGGVVLCSSHGKDFRIKEFPEWLGNSVCKECEGAKNGAS
jgi:hypothetical protein